MSKKWHEKVYEKKLVKKASLKNGKKLCKKFFMAAHWGHHLASPKKKLMAEQGQTQKDAVKAVSAETGVKKNALYRYVLDHEE